MLGQRGLVNFHDKILKLQLTEHLDSAPVQVHLPGAHGSAGCRGSVRTVECSEGVVASGRNGGGWQSGQTEMERAKMDQVILEIMDVELGYA